MKLNCVGYLYPLEFTDSRFGFRLFGAVHPDPNCGQDRSSDDQRVIQTVLIFLFKTSIKDFQAQEKPPAVQAFFSNIFAF